MTLTDPRLIATLREMAALSYLYGYQYRQASCAKLASAGLVTAENASVHTKTYHITSAGRAELARIDKERSGK